MKRVVFLLGILLLIGAGCSYNSSKDTSVMKKKCLTWSVYDPDKKAWRWMTEGAIDSGKGGFFPTRDESVENCLVTFDSLNEE